MGTVRQSPHEHRRRMCDRKRRVNWKIAHQAVEAMRERGYPVHAYKCPYCGAIHVGRSSDVEIGATDVN